MIQESAAFLYCNIKYFGYRLLVMWNMQFEHLTMEYGVMPFIFYFL